MPPRASSRAASAKPASRAASKPKSAAKAASPPASKAPKSAKATKEEKVEAKAKATAKATKADTKPAKAAKSAKADTKPASKATKATKATTTKATKATKAKAAKADVESEAEAEAEAEPKPAPKAKANGTKRGRTSDAAEAPAPKRHAPVKRRRARAEVNKLPAVPEPPQGLAVFIWGSGEFNQLGLGPDEVEEVARPKLHAWFQEQKEEGKLGSGEDKGGVEAIAAGGMHSIAVDELGQVHSWGVNDNAALGRKTDGIPDPEKEGENLDSADFEAWPLIVESLKENGDTFRPVKVAASDSASFAIDNKGELRAWGSFRAEDGTTLFDATHRTQIQPVELPALAGVEVVDIACGNDHAVALTSDGDVYTWGAAEKSQLARRLLGRRNMHGQFSLEPGRLGLRNIVHIAAGGSHSFAVDKDGRVFAWGMNASKQLGLDGPEADEDLVNHPVEVTALAPSEHDGARVVQIAGSDFSSFFLFDNGAVFGVGSGDDNALGLGADHPELEKVKERKEEAKAKVEQDMADIQKDIDQLKKKHTDESLAKLEINPITVLESELEKKQKSLTTQQKIGDVPEPVRIVFPPIPESYEVVPEFGAYSEEIINPIAQISAGTRHIHAVSRSGHLYSWGVGEAAELGLGNASSAEVPTLVRSKQLKEYNSVYVSAGGQHCVLLAKKKDE